MKNIGILLLIFLIIFKIFSKMHIFQNKIPIQNRKLLFPSIETQYDIRIRNLESSIEKNKETLNFIES